ncbi:MAG: hypothetical protein ACFFCS_22300 [Candidatus Hodarchaeota archaeon]
MDGNEQDKRDENGRNTHPVKCMVKNCQKILQEDEAVKIGEKTFCKTCAVYYIKSKFSFLG